ncbi:MAG: hypothetical protein SFY69_00385 [Planctomycetota bacterium]|nr:hypothetical protein [Planctomycetota bacterium]
MTADAPQRRDVAADATGGASRFAGALVMLAALALRCTVGFDPFPGWSGDPFAVVSPIVGLTPLMAMLCDAALLLGALLALVGGARAGRSPAWWEIGLVVAGLVPIVWHAYANGPHRFDSAWMGASWGACVAAGLACRSMAADARSRQVLLAGVLGVGVLLALRAAVQVFIEHPETLATFRRTREAFFESQGWSLDSPMARAYERRIAQADASAWFGMSNVLAGVGAAVASASLALLLVSRREPGGASPAGTSGPARAARDAAADRGAIPLVGVVTAFVAGVACVVLAGSKGGYAALVAGAALGASTLVFGRLRARAARGAGVGLGVAAFLGVPAVVVVRGALGEHLGELSVLFRWFYTVGAVRVFGEFPLLGSSPDGFKDVYARLKVPIAPEDVASPHALALDWAATLGVGGVALAALVLAWCVMAGRGLGTERASEDAPAAPVSAASHAPLRTDVLAIVGCIALAVVVGSRIESSIATVEAALVRLFGLGGAGVVAAGVLMALRARGAGHTGSGLRAAGVAGLCLAGVAQFDVVASIPGALAVLMIFLGLGAGAQPSTARASAGASATPRSVVRAWAGVAVGAGVLMVCVLVPLRAAWRWDGALREAYALAEPVAMLSARLADLRDGRAPREAGRAWLADLAAECAASGVPGPDPAREDPGNALLRLRRARGESALAALERALAAAPDHPDTSHAVDRLRLAQASVLLAGGDRAGASDAARRAASDALRFAERAGTSSSWGHAGAACRAAGEIAGDEALQIEAERAWSSASVRSPYAVVYPMLIAQSAAARGQRALAGIWAAKALEVDGLMRLDPAQGLSEAKRAELRALVEAGSGEPREAS